MDNKNKSRGKENGELTRFKVYCNFFVSSESIVKVGSVEVRYQRSRAQRWEGEPVKLGLFLLLLGGGGSFFGLQPKNWSFLPH